MPLTIAPLCPHQPSPPSSYTPLYPQSGSTPWWLSEVLLGLQGLTMKQVPGG